MHAHTDCLINRRRKITTTGGHATKLFDLCTYEIAFLQQGAIFNMCTEECMLQNIVPFVNAWTMLY